MSAPGGSPAPSSSASDQSSKGEELPDDLLSLNDQVRLSPCIVALFMGITSQVLLVCRIYFLIINLNDSMTKLYFIRMRC